MTSAQFGPRYVNNSNRRPHFHNSFPPPPPPYNNFAHAPPPYTLNSALHIDKIRYLPPIAKDILAILNPELCPNTSWIYGGFVRDYLIGKQANDYDIVTMLSQDELMAIFNKNKIFDFKFLQKTEAFSANIGHFYYNNVRFDFRYDLKNIMDLVDPNSDECINFNCNVGLVDRYGYIYDLTKFYDFTKKEWVSPLQAYSNRREISCIRDPDIEFQKRPINILNILRIISNTNSRLPIGIAKSIKNNKEYLKTLPASIIRNKLIEMFKNKNKANSFHLLSSLGLIEILFEKLLLDENTMFTFDSDVLQQEFEFIYLKFKDMDTKQDFNWVKPTLTLLYSSIAPPPGQKVHLQPPTSHNSSPTNFEEIRSRLHSPASSNSSSNSSPQSLPTSHVDSEEEDAKSEVGSHSVPLSLSPRSVEDEDVVQVEGAPNVQVPKDAKKEKARPKIRDKKEETEFDQNQKYFDRQELVRSTRKRPKNHPTRSSSAPDSATSTKATTVIFPTLQLVTLNTPTTLNPLSPMEFIAAHKKAYGVESILERADKKMEINFFDGFQFVGEIKLASENKILLNGTLENKKSKVCYVGEAHLRQKGLLEPKRFKTIDRCELIFGHKMEIADNVPYYGRVESVYECIHGQERLLEYHYPKLNFVAARGQDAFTLAKSYFNAESGIKEIYTQEKLNVIFKKSPDRKVRLKINQETGILEEGGVLFFDESLFCGQFVHGIPVKGYVWKGTEEVPFEITEKNKSIELKNGKFICSYRNDIFFKVSYWPMKFANKIRLARKKNPAAVFFGFNLLLTLFVSFFTFLLRDSSEINK